jgi:NADH:ubiquinone oxidoreductase subunit 2 (subunit N)
VLDQKSVEAGIKYLFGAMTSAVMLYGLASAYRTTNIMRSRKSPGRRSFTAGFRWTALLILVGFGFKISTVPFHFGRERFEGADPNYDLSTASGPPVLLIARV